MTLLSSTPPRLPPSRRVGLFGQDDVIGAQLTERRQPWLELLVPIAASIFYMPISRRHA